jgi:hypothetical protein
MDGKRLATKRLVRYIEQNCFRKTFLSLADEVGLDGKTIRGVFDDYVRRLQEAVKFETRELLGLDEIKIAQGYRAVITNVERNTPTGLVGLRLACGHQNTQRLLRMSAFDPQIGPSRKPPI